MPNPKRSFLRIFTESGPLVALTVAIALLVGIAGPASAQFFNFGNFGAPPTAAAADSAAARRWRLVRKRHLRAVPAAGAAARGSARGFFQGAGAGEARHRGGAQHPGARRRHGGLAGLRPRGRLFRTARHGHHPQAQDRLRPDQVSAQGRSRRLGRRRQGHPRHREAGRHCRHARPQRPRFDARTCVRRQEDGQERRQEGCQGEAGCQAFGRQKARWHR